MHCSPFAHQRSVINFRHCILKKPCWIILRQTAESRDLSADTAAQMQHMLHGDFSGKGVCAQAAQNCYLTLGTAPPFKSSRLAHGKIWGVAHLRG